MLFKSVILKNALISRLKRISSPQLTPNLYISMPIHNQKRQAQSIHMIYVTAGV